MKNKGFTLIELIGVLVIMALILLIVFPATMKLMKDNDQERFEHYYEMVVNATGMYANSIRDDLGGVTAKGCVDDVMLIDLINKKLVKEYDDEEVNCGSPSEFELDKYGIDTTKEYVDIRISNNKGKISSEVSLICIKGRKVVYDNLIEKKSTDKCDRYVAEATNTLVNEAMKLTSSTDDSVNYYIAGSVQNNYVWYSGKLWRMVGYNKVDRTIKLVTENPISVLSYDMLSSNYSESNIYLWLNNIFLPTLRNNDTMLVNTKWNFTTVANATRPAETNIDTSRVGMLTYYEYDKIKGFLNNSTNWWLLSRSSNTNAWYVGANGTVANTNVATFYGVKPSVVLKPNITYIKGGDGTVNNPYKLNGDSGANPSTPLNTRYPGEYVTFGGLQYRIVKTTPEYTRLILSTNLTSVGNSVFDNINRYHYNLDATVGNLLNSTWHDELDETSKNKLYSGDFCTMTLTPSISQTTACSPENIYYYKIGIPKIGDMFTSPTSSGEYWTLSNASEFTLNVVSPNGTVSSKGIAELSGVRPVINIESNVKIAGGNGTNNNPYTLE